MSEITLNAITKVFDNKKHVIENLSLHIADGSFTVLLGPSGCGKTTLLRIIAGLETVTDGEVSIGGQNVTQMEPGERGVAMVFQNYAIYPHMNVQENIEFGLRNMKIPKQKCHEITARVLKTVGLENEALTKPSKLSGGQRQRIALARAISKDPEVFLMDEPLSNLDAKLRMNMRSELIQLHRSLKTTFVFVTHDQTEAMTMGDHIVVLNKGFIMQEGTAQEIYNNPQNVFVARFIGNPGMNVLPLQNGEGFWGFRPRAVRMASFGSNDISVTGKVRAKEFLGEEILYTVASGSAEIAVIIPDDAFQPGDLFTGFVPGGQLYFFDSKENRCEAPKDDSALNPETGSYAS
jgi:sn-glycerol 3-phosphate transport system ATP-binding protein